MGLYWLLQAFKTQSMEVDRDAAFNASLISTSINELDIFNTNSSIDSSPAVVVPASSSCCLHSLETASQSAH